LSWAVGTGDRPDPARTCGSRFPSGVPPAFIRQMTRRSAAPGLMREPSRG